MCNIGLIGLAPISKGSLLFSKNIYAHQPALREEAERVWQEYIILAPATFPFLLWNCLQKALNLLSQEPCGMAECEIIIKAFQTRNIYIWIRENAFLPKFKTIFTKFKIIFTKKGGYIGFWTNCFNFPLQSWPMGLI